MDHHAELAQAAHARALAELQFHRADERYRALMAVAVRAAQAPVPSMAKATIDKALASIAQRSPGIAGASLGAPAIELANEQHFENQALQTRVDRAEPQSDMERMVAAIQGSVKLATA